MHLVFFLAICVEEQMSHQYFWFKSRYPVQRTCICLLYNRWMDAGGRQKENFQKHWHERWVLFRGTGRRLVGSIQFVCRFICCLQDLGHFWGKGGVEGSFYHLLVFTRRLSQFSRSLGAFTEQEFKLWGLICLSSDPLSSNHGTNGHSCPNPFPSGPIWR